MVKPDYIQGCSVYYFSGHILFHLWLVDLLHLWLKVITFKVSITFMVNFVTFMVGITSMVFIACMGDTKANTVVLYYTFLGTKQPITRLIPIYRFSDCVTTKDIPLTPNASCDVFTRKGINSLCLE